MRTFCFLFLLSGCLAQAAQTPKLEAAKAALKKFERSEKDLMKAEVDLERFISKGGSSVQIHWALKKFESKLGVCLETSVELINAVAEAATELLDTENPTEEQIEGVRAVKDGIAKFHPEKYSGLHREAKAALHSASMRERRAREMKK